jgi:hypothetical protein
LADLLVSNGRGDDDEAPGGSQAGEGGAEARGAGAGKGTKSEPDGKAEATEGGDANGEAEGAGGKGSPEAGHRAFLNRKARRIAEAQGQVGQQMTALGHTKRDVEARAQRVAHLEGIDELLRRDPIAALQKLQLDPTKTVQSYIEWQRTGGGDRSKAPAGAPAEGEGKTESELRKEIEDMKAREAERTSVAATREWVSGVSADSHPHLSVYFGVEATDPKRQAKEIVECLGAFEQRHHRPPKSDAELRGFMNAQAKQWFATNRARFEAMKNIYEPGAGRQSEDARRTAGDGAPGAPDPKGRSSEGRKAARPSSLTNRASTDAGTPSKSYDKPGDVARALMPVLATADDD